MAPPTSRLQAILGPLPPRVLRALESVNPSAFLPPSLGPIAGADAPLPFLERDDAVALTPSPRVLALVLHLLDLEEGQRVLVLGAESGYLAALCIEAGAASVHVVEPDLAAAEAARGFVQNAAFTSRITVTAGPPAKEPGGPWDRVLLLDPRRTLTAALSERIADLGFALAFVHTSRGWDVVKTLRSEGQMVEIRATELSLAGGIPGEEGLLIPAAARKRLGGLLALEEIASNVWRGATPSAPEVELREGVRATWRQPGPAAEPSFEGTRRELAMKVFHLGYVHQAVGDVDNAADLYQRSSAVLPTAEASTFLGWVHANEGRLMDAMACCHRAIAIDPSLGNPYNDIGAYLIQLGRPAEAVPWLERAIRAERYEAPFFPHLNLARVKLAAGELEPARKHLERVLEMNPGYQPALDLLKEIDSVGT